MRAMSKVRIAVLGAGTVGSQVIRLLGERAEDFAARAGGPMEVIGIGVKNLAAERDPWIDRALLTDDLGSLATSADIVIELIGGIEPARELVLAALGSGATVVTGNKALLAAHGPELFEAAAASGADLYYEAAVAGAVPVVYALRESLAGDTVTRVLGIVNGTTNFILDRMSTAGLSFGDALAEAQALGFAEADPTADVDGYDAAAKAALLASLAFHSRVGLDDVEVRGIRDVTAADIELAAEQGYALKLLAIAERVEGGVAVRVEPTLVPLSHPLAAVNGSFNAVVVEAEAADRLMFYGRGAGGAPTASAVLSDVVAGASHKVRGGHAPRENPYAALPVVPASEVRTARQVRLAVDDKVGVLASVASTFARHGVSIESVRQTPGEGGTTLTIVTHVARNADVDATVTELGAVSRVVSVMAVESD